MLLKDLNSWIGLVGLLLTLGGLGDHRVEVGLTATAGVLGSTDTVEGAADGHALTTVLAWIWVARVGRWLDG